MDSCEDDSVDAVVDNDCCSSSELVDDNVSKVLVGSLEEVETMEVNPLSVAIVEETIFNEDETNEVESAVVELSRIGVVEAEIMDKTADSELEDVLSIIDELESLIPRSVDTGPTETVDDELEIDVV